MTDKWGPKLFSKSNVSKDAEIERLRTENGRLRAAFRVNMMRLAPELSHAEITKFLDECETQ